MKHPIEALLNEVGIVINGNNPWDIKVNDRRFFNKVLYQQSIGAGESYMQGWWDCDQLDQLFFRILNNQQGDKFYSRWKFALMRLKNSFINQQTPQKSEKVAKIHYDLSNKLFELMLGKSMAYTCGYWKDARTLDEAQFAKYELVCKKLYLQPKDKVLEIGCGWGGLAKYMAEKYGCEVVALDIGNRPSSYAKQHCKDLPVTVYQCDYRDTNIYNPKQINFDKIVSVGVLEHVGYKNYATLMNLCHSFIKKNGIFLLHSIGRDTSTNFCDPWVNKYIFPNGMLPSLRQLGTAFENKFVVEDLHNFGANYDNTLMAWYKNLSENWSQLKPDHDEIFHRMMNYYLLSCAGAFRARNMQLWQFVLTPEGILNGYSSIR